MYTGTPTKFKLATAMESMDAKIVLLGAQGVGKTCFVTRYVNNKFQAGQASTIGASFSRKRVVVNDTTVRLQIWDTAGQERFRSMAPIYYRSASCGILCYDVTSRASFEAMHLWLLELKQNLSSDIIIHIVGTKVDLVKEEPSLREVPFEQCVEYASEWLQDDSCCHEISAKDDEGVEEVFEVIITKLLDKREADEQQKHNSQRQRQSVVYLHTDEDEHKSSCC